MQQVGKNPLGLEAMQQGGESSQDKTVQKCVKACLAYCSQQTTRSPTQNLLILHSGQALMDEELFGIFRFARKVVTPFKEICWELVL